MPPPDPVAWASLVTAIASLVVSVFALCVAIYAIRRANQTSSAATLVNLNEGFRQAWSRFHQAATPPARGYEIAELLNLAEVACGMLLEHSLTGNSRVLLEEYVGDCLSLMTRNPEVNEMALQLLQVPDTFIFIRQFLRRRELPAAAKSLPVEWFQLP